MAQLLRNVVFNHPLYALQCPYRHEPCSTAYTAHINLTQSDHKHTIKTALLTSFAPTSSPDVKAITLPSYQPLNSPTSHHPHPHPPPYLPITLRHPLQLILLLNRIAITTPLRRINQLLGQTLRHALHIPERRLPRPDRQQRYRLVDPAQRGHVHGLATHGARAADARAVFARAAVHDRVDGDLERVRVRHDVDLCVNEGKLLARAFSLASLVCGVGSR